MAQLSIQSYLFVISSPYSSSRSFREWIEIFVQFQLPDVRTIGFLQWLASRVRFWVPFGVRAEPFWKIVEASMKILSTYYEIKQERSSQRHTIQESGCSAYPGTSISLKLLFPDPGVNFPVPFNFNFPKYKMVSFGLIKFSTSFSIRAIWEFLFSSSSGCLDTINDSTVYNFLYLIAGALGSSTLLSFLLVPVLPSAFFSLLYSCLPSSLFPPFSFSLLSFFFSFFYFFSYLASSLPPPSFSSFYFFFWACFSFQRSVFFLSTSFAFGFLVSLAWFWVCSLIFLIIMVNIIGISFIFNWKNNKEMKKNIKGKENTEPAKDAPERVRQEPVKEEKVAEKPSKSSKDLKQKLLKVSNAKVTHKQQFGPPLANSLQKMPAKASNHPTRSHLKSATNKIKQNQQKILNASQLLANSRSSEQLLSSVPLTKGQNQRLRLYFKYLCELVQSYPKRTTFQDVKNMFETINMTEWMIFCKNMGITERIKGRGQGIRFLSFVFKKYEDIERRMGFQKFGLAVRQVIIEIAGNMKEEASLNAQGKQNQPQEATQLTFQMKLKQILDWLNLTDKKKHTRKLKQMGIMCSEEVYTIPKHSQIYTSTERKPVQTQSQNPIRSSLPHSNSSSFHVNESSPSSPPPKRQLPKIYRTHLQRKQSKLMHSLAVTNLNKFTPTQDTKDFLQKYIGYDDRYLKQYFHKQDSVKNGVMAKLEARSKGKSRRF